MGSQGPGSGRAVWARRLGWGLLGLVLGVAVGLPGVFAHATWWGLLLVVVTTAAMAAALPTAGRVGFAIGWVVPVLRGALTKPEGDYLVQTDWHGYGLLIVGFALILATIITAPTPRRGVAEAEVQPPPT